MYIDYTIKVSEKLPDDLKADIKKMEDAYNRDDFFEYVKYEDSVLVAIKACAMGGIINDSKLNELMRRFGWR